MNLYVESSAVVAWLLGEQPSAGKVRDLIKGAETVVSSELTLVECDRVLIRAAATGRIGEAQAADRRAVLAKAAVCWHLVRLAGEVIERARRPFPREPVRTLDALHLASALLVRSAVAGLEILSLDERVRENAKALGFRVYP